MLSLEEDFKRFVEYENYDESQLHPLKDLNRYYEAYKKSMKGSSWKPEPQRFEGLFLFEIRRLRKDITNHTYVTTKGTEFVLNERGHLRYIHGGRMRDRVVRHLLCDDILNPILKPYLIHNNGASQKGKGMTFARDMFVQDLHNYYLEHGNNKGYIGFVDFSKFYDNIRHEKVKEAIFPKIDEESKWLLSEVLKSFEVDISYLSEVEAEGYINEKFNSIEYHEQIRGKKLTGEIMMPKSVDIGDQVSQTIGIFFPTYVDNYVKIVRGIKRYGRYMDDMYIIGETKEEVQDIIDGIRECAKTLGLFVNDKKTYICKLSDNYTYLQVKYYLDDNGKVVQRINPKSVTRERRKLKKYKGLVEQDIMPYDDAVQAYKSWMGAYTRMMSKQQIKNMKKLFIELFGEDVRWKK